MQRREALRGLSALGASVLAGCGKGVSAISGPDDAPSSPTGNWVRMSFSSLRKQAPVSGASVVLTNGTQLTTGAGGEVTVPEGGVVEVTAPGAFGPRRVRAASGMQDWLLPDDSQMPAWWVRQALYGANDFSWLWRPLPGSFTIVPAPDVFADSFAMNALRQGADIINGVHRHLTFNVGTPGQTGRTVDIVLNTGITAFAETLIRATGATTTGARIQFSTFRLPGFNRTDQERHAVRAVAHELAHVAGLSGHPTPISGVYSRGIMWGEGAPSEFAQPEADILNWLFHREPGTRPPDDSSSTPVISAQSSGSSWRLVCQLER